MDKLIKNKYIPMSETMIYILLSLQNELHGYGIRQNVSDLTDGRIILGAGTIYQTLGKLEKGKLIVCVKEEDRRKIYICTPLGIEILESEKQRLKEIYLNLEELL